MKSTDTLQVGAVTLDALLQSEWLSKRASLVHRQSDLHFVPNRNEIALHTRHIHQGGRHNEIPWGRTATIIGHLPARVSRMGRRCVVNISVEDKGASVYQE